MFLSDFARYCLSYTTLNIPHERLKGKMCENYYSCFNQGCLYPLIKKQQQQINYLQRQIDNQNIEIDNQNKEIENQNKEIVNQNARILALEFKSVIHGDEITYLLNNAAIIGQDAFFSSVETFDLTIVNLRSEETIPRDRLVVASASLPSSIIKESESPPTIYSNPQTKIIKESESKPVIYYNHSSRLLNKKPPFLKTKNPSWKSRLQFQNNL